MPINFEEALGNHEQALMIRSRRAGILAANLANADTPNYKARDIDFKQALQQAAGGQLSLEKSHASHMDIPTSSPNGGELLYRIPQQSSLDGNTVDVNKEQAEFGENAVRYQTTLRFLGGKFKGMIGALKGE